ncbi:DgyrCDS9695 [Dimorphilus gyrociliatus]|uniref:DgyrCDS9695 n=1 Tax=Dimorphilus gyrociliatus TaxID=2664684 RepID=A0A7I8W0F9_9ANNE|nr:DgyrCDS9695 [Dimorphilus gyrociliatus]
MLSLLPHMTGEEVDEVVQSFYVDDLVLAGTTNNDVVKRAIHQDGRVDVPAEGILGLKKLGEIAKLRATDRVLGMALLSVSNILKYKQREQDNRDVQSVVCCAKDCTYTDWSEWSKCDDLCSGTQEKERRREIKAKAVCGGKDCKERLREKKNCNSEFSFPCWPGRPAYFCKCSKGFTQVNGRCKMIKSERTTVKVHSFMSILRLREMDIVEQLDKKINNIQYVNGNLIDITYKYNLSMNLTVKETNHFLIESGIYSYKFGLVDLQTSMYIKNVNADEIRANVSFLTDNCSTRVFSRDNPYSGYIVCQKRYAKPEIIHGEKLCFLIILKLGGKLTIDADLLPPSKIVGTHSCYFGPIEESIERCITFDLLPPKHCSTFKKQPISCQKEPIKINCDDVNELKTLTVLFSGWNDTLSMIKSFTASIYSLHVIEGNYERKEIIDSMDSYSPNDTEMSLKFSDNGGFFEVELQAFDNALNVEKTSRLIEILKDGNEYKCHTFLLKSL